MLTFPSRMVLNTAPSILLACSCRPMCLSIITPLSSNAVGLALFFPAMSGAVPCTFEGYNYVYCIYNNYARLPTASKSATLSKPMLPLGVTPNPPTKPAHKSLLNCKIFYGLDVYTAYLKISP